jgi:hypothetical protein
MTPDLPMLQGLVYNGVGLMLVLHLAQTLQILVGKWWVTNYGRD